MRILSRAIFREVFTSASMGTLLFIFVLFLRTIERLSALLVKTSAPPAVVAKLLAYALPATIPFALPLGVLVGILIGLSRMSADNEITAMRAAGVSSLTVARPVLLFASVALIVTAAASLWLTPLSLHLESLIARRFAAAQLTGDIETRIFDEDFPDMVIYVNDVTRARGQIVWHQLFIADVTPPAKLEQSGKDRGEGPRIIIAEEAIPHPDEAHNRIILQMRNVRTSERDKEGKVIITSAPFQIQALQAQKEEDLQVNKTVQEMDVGPLYRRVYGPDHAKLSQTDYNDAAIELHQRFALPLACVLLALVGIPLGISSRKGGKSAAFVMTVLLAFLYYLAFITLIGLAKKGSLPVPVAVWMPDAVFAVVGTVLFVRLERPGDRDLAGTLRALFVRAAAFFRRFAEDRRPALPSAAPLGFRGFLLRPMLVDAYVLNGFLFYLGVLLMALVCLIEVFTFFELLGDMIKNNIGMPTMLDYLWHLAPKLIYDVTPIGILVASLICFGILTKHNEVTAFKAGGVSVHRLAAPVLAVSLLISGLLFAFDHYYIPEANRRQEMLRAEIKKKPVQTYLDPNRQWIYGQGSRIYNYQFMDPHQAIMSRVNVYELDPSTFHIVHQISAERARWEPALETWVFQNGMSEDFHHGKSEYREFYGASATFPELTEHPSWFVKEEKEYKEMNFEELAQYIRDLKGAGMETTPLQVQYYKKFSVPLFALIMALLSIPFAFVAGSRGAMTGVGISFGIAIAYWTLNTAFEQIGDLNQLPAMMAAWSPDVIFSLWGLYLMARMRT